MPLRLFAFEYVTAGGWREIAAPPSLIAEGAMMLRALVRDLARLPGIEPVVAIDPAVPAGPLAASLMPVDPRDLWGSWRRIAARCTLAWPVAPETGGLLEEVARLLAAAGCEPLLSRAPALAVARSKQATVACLAAHGISAVVTVPLEADPPPASQGWVVKPEDGAGAADTQLAADAEALARLRRAKRGQGYVVQPFLPGAPLSLSLLAKNGDAWLLACNRQDVTLAEGVFRYRGGIVGAAEARRAVLAPLAQRIAAALPDLWGYVGVDLIEGGAGRVVLEVNPRLTTSYVGLADSLALNPAELVLALRQRSIADLVRPLAPQPVPVAVPAA